MAQIRAQHATFSFAEDAPLFEDANFILEPGWTGLVGPNGAGKTTLLRLLAGELPPRRGALLCEPEWAPLILCRQRVDELEESIQDFASSTRAEAARLRGMLDLSSEELRRWPSLSPGERKRWQLGAALAAEPDVLLLDEPTNHVDAEARRLLLAALRSFRGAGVVVSHDRTLLDELTERTLRLDGGELRLFGGSYSRARAQWEAELQQRREARERAQEQTRKEKRRIDKLRREQEAATAQRNTGRRMRNRHDSDARTLAAGVRVEKAEASIGKRLAHVQTRLKRAARDPALEGFGKELGGSIFLRYEPPRRPHLLVLERDRIGHGGRTLLQDVRLAMGPGERVALAGPNGSGKSTLVATLLEESSLPAEKIFYLPQELSEEEGQSLLLEVRALPREERGRVLSLVAALGLDPQRLLASAAPSPGETRKLAIASGMGRHAWILILDEPTNHLDLPSIERLQAALEAWPGALLLVTHDETLAERCSDRRWRIEEGRVRIG